MKGNNEFKPLETKLIKRIEITDSTQLRIVVNKFEDKRVLVDMRVWYRRKGDPKYLPSGKGLSTSPTNLKSLRLALKRAEAISTTFATKKKKKD